MKLTGIKKASGATKHLRPYCGETVNVYLDRKTGRVWTYPFVGYGDLLFDDNDDNDTICITRTDRPMSMEQIRESVENILEYVEWLESCQKGDRI